MPGAAAAVVAVLTRSEEPLTLRQIAERAGVSHPQVSRHVERLEALGLAHRAVVGRSHQVKLTRSAAADLLRRLNRLDAVVMEHVRSTAPTLEPNAVNVAIFGSFVRGTARADSDIDVVVIAEEPSDEGWLATLAAWADDLAVVAGNPVAEMVVAVEDLPVRVDDPLWDSIAKEGSQSPASRSAMCSNRREPGWHRDARSPERPGRDAAARS